jgi:mRNA-degrading endonuclease toxin of MazEF toxin-antitoxin module
VNEDDYDKWNILKKQLNALSKDINLKNGNIYLVSIGKNISNEVYGKGTIFLRPVLVLKKLGHNYFLGIPLTSKEKRGSYFFEFSYKEKSSYAMFNQVRTFNSNRILKQHGKMKKYEFEALKKKFIEFLR